MANRYGYTHMFRAVIFLVVAAVCAFVAYAVQKNIIALVAGYSLLGISLIVLAIGFGQVQSLKNRLKTHLLVTQATAEGLRQSFFATVETAFNVCEQAFVEIKINGWDLRFGAGSGNSIVITGINPNDPSTHGPEKMFRYRIEGNDELVQALSARIKEILRQEQFIALRPKLPF